MGAILITFINHLNQSNRQKAENQSRASEEIESTHVKESEITKPILPGTLKDRKNAEIVVPSIFKKTLLRVKQLDDIVRSSEYQECLTVKALLTMVAMEAEGLPKKLARTMSSMAEQNTRLNQILSDLKINPNIRNNPCINALESQLANRLTEHDEWRRECDATTFIFLNELLKNIIESFLSQAHQESTIWSFAHFVGLLLRASQFKRVVQPLWEYNLCAQTCAIIPVWDVSARGNHAENIVRLFIATHICEPNVEKVWTYIASLINDIKSSPTAKAVSLHCLTAVVEIGGPWLNEKYANDYRKIVQLIQSTILPELKLSAEFKTPEAQVRLVKLEEGLNRKVKPDGYMLSPREQDLTIE